MKTPPSSASLRRDLLWVFAGAALLYLSLRHLGVDEDLNLLASFAAGLVLRLAAIRWHWSLPVFSYAPGRWNG